MNYRWIACFIITTFTASLAAGQELRRAILEEIQAIPKEPAGEWIVGGYKFVVNDATQISREHPATVGVLAEVEFVARNGVAIATRIAPQSIKASEVNDGPHVFWRDETTAVVAMLRNGKPQRTTYENLTKPRTVRDLPGVETSVTLDPAPPIPPKSSWDAPSRLLAISDLEGNYTNTLKFLKNNQVVDPQGHWNWGDGHLVLIGDLVDRGQEVTELMWMLRRLEREAQAAGGEVHYVLGNHEVMVMGGDLRYVHPTYHFISGRLGVSYDQLYGADSDIGRWWRSKNAVLRIGDLLFVHGGYSPSLDRAQLDINTLNQRVRAGLPPARPTGLTVETNPVMHQHGPFWYRGYFSDYAAGWGGKATSEEVDRILQRHQVKHIVVGHTLVEKVGPVDNDSRVIGIDVDWKMPDKGQGLLWEKNKLWRLTNSAQREEIVAGAGR